MLQVKAESDLPATRSVAAEEAPGLHHPATALDWDGANDPENPHNWSKLKQAYHMLVPSALGFLASYGTSAYSPGIEGVSTEFGVSREVAVLPLSLYVLGLALGPLVAAGISETFGRRIVYLTCTPVCLLFTLGAGFSQNIASLLACRFLAATAGAAPLVVGVGIIAEIFLPHRRAYGISMWVLAPFLGPALGPSTTSYAAQLKGWRWTQWIMLFIGVPIYLASLFQQETYKKIILQQRAKRFNLTPPHDPIPQGRERVKFLFDMVCLRAMRMLFTEPIVAYFSIYTAFTFAVLFGFFTSFPYVYSTVYNFNTGESGLVFLSTGIGCVLATFAFVEINKRTYVKKALERISNGDAQPMPPEERLYPAMIGCFLVPIGLFWFAWTAKENIHWLVPTLALIPFNTGNLMVFDTALLYLTDVYGPLGGSSANAANSFLRYLIAEKAFEKIDIFEQRDRVGGIWNLSEPTLSKRIPVPQSNPRYGYKRGAKAADGGSGDNFESLEFESPLYDYLETNIPKGLMAYSDKPFPDQSPLYPSHQEVLQYLEDYADDIKHLIQFKHQVRDVMLDQASTSDHDVWRLEVEDLKSGNVSAASYDAVVIANGHYTIPSLPRINGIKEWNKTYPGSIIHSKAYRRPQDYCGKKVLVIGNSASGLDIAFQVSQKCKQPILLSSRSVSAFGSMPPASWRRDVGEVVEFLPASVYDRAVKLRDGSIEKDIHAVIFATGYFYSYPFLSKLTPPIITDGLRTQDVYQHLFHIEHPSLVFPVINLKVVPFPLAENQAAVVARVWSGRMRLPSEETMREWEKETIKHKGNGKYFHLKKLHEDAAQINDLYRWARSATRLPDLENDGSGKLGSSWGEREVWTRSKFPQIKAAYAARGDERIHAKSIEELGFDFHKWQQNANREDLEIFEAARVLKDGERKNGV